MTTYEAAIRLLTAETPEEKERTGLAYTATWTAAPPAVKAKRAKAKAVPPNNCREPRRLEGRRREIVPDRDHLK
jgi:hypothetical protein